MNLRCQECRQPAAELFPARRKDSDTREIEFFMLCHDCVPKCSNLINEGLTLRLCGEPKDHRSEHYCLGCELDVCWWKHSVAMEYTGPERDEEAIAEYRQQIAELEAA